VSAPALAGDPCAAVARVCAAPAVRVGVLTVAAVPARPGAVWVRVAARRHADTVITALARAGYAVDPPGVRHVATGPEPLLTVTPATPAPGARKDDDS